MSSQMVDEYERLMEHYRVAEFLDRNGTIAASKRAPEHMLPKIGDIILYNENTSQIEPGMGSFGKTPRGICRVVSYDGTNGCLMRVKIYRKPGCNRTESFHTSDFRFGLYLYRRLSDYIYTADRYTFYDLDLMNPHEDIMELFMDDGNYLVPEEKQMFAAAFI